MRSVDLIPFERPTPVISSEHKVPIQVYGNVDIVIGQGSWGR